MKFERLEYDINGLKWAEGLGNEEDVQKHADLVLQGESVQK